MDEDTGGMERQLMRDRCNAALLLGSIGPRCLVCMCPCPYKCVQASKIGWRLSWTAS